MDTWTKRIHTVNMGGYALKTDQRTNAKKVVHFYAFQRDLAIDETAQ